MNNSEKHMQICKTLNQIYTQKNHDYGNSFGDMYKKLGIITAVTRIGDKYNRLVNLVSLPKNEQKIKDESIRDNFLDIANYCIMTVMEMDEENN